eukprot:TRINITY_DN11300_c0_g1_i1.p1 TRINITY_DN11300_c0_g1~~TRINITY_DN11300_c0_g1_i1.p1  ORF type:complete len:146 (+),score=31.56 TRINITY_DN11300_c0_g1_i1:127-564(+)
MTRPDEVKRIEESGGFVTEGRVEGVINMSRALGDHVFKYPLNDKVFNQDGSKDVKADFITVEPYINTVSVENQDFMIIGSDGVWDELSDGEAVDMVAKLWEKGLKANEIAQRLVKDLAKRNFSDNVTCIIVFFRRKNIVDGEQSK